jgi:hypothetical protein
MYLLCVLGCPIDIGFRVQYSDLAQLKWVQLQVLGTNNLLMIEGLDNSTRAQWDGKDMQTPFATLMYFCDTFRHSSANITSLFFPPLNH